MRKYTENGEIYPWLLPLWRNINSPVRIRIWLVIGGSHNHLTSTFAFGMSVIHHRQGFIKKNLVGYTPYPSITISLREYQYGPGSYSHFSHRNHLYYQNNHICCKQTNCGCLLRSILNQKASRHYRRAEQSTVPALAPMASINASKPRTVRVPVA